MLIERLHYGLQRLDHSERFEVRLLPVQDSPVLPLLVLLKVLDEVFEVTFFVDFDIDDGFSGHLPAPSSHVGGIQPPSARGRRSVRNRTRTHR